MDKETVMTGKVVSRTTMPDRSVIVRVEIPEDEYTAKVRVDASLVEGPSYVALSKANVGDQVGVRVRENDRGGFDAIGAWRA